MCSVCTTYALNRLYALCMRVVCALYALYTRCAALQYTQSTALQHTADALQYGRVAMTSVATATHPRHKTRCLLQASRLRRGHRRSSTYIYAPRRAAQHSHLYTGTAKALQRAYRGSTGALYRDKHVPAENKGSGKNERKKRAKNQQKHIKHSVKHNCSSYQAVCMHNVCRTGAEAASWPHRFPGTSITLCPQ